MPVPTASAELRHARRQGSAKRLRDVARAATNVRVVRNSADSSLDYFVARETAKTLGMPMVQVYANELTYYDPKGEYLKHRV